SHERDSGDKSIPGSATCASHDTRYNPAASPAALRGRSGASSTDKRRHRMRRALALLLIAGFLGAAGPAAAQSPIIMAQFWYSFGGTNREVTEAHIKRFNESQSKYRIEGTYQGDYFEALAKIRAAAATKTAPAAFHVIGEAIPQLAASGLFENLEPYAKGANGADLEDYLPGQTQHTYFDYLGKPAAPLGALPFFPSTR